MANTSTIFSALGTIFSIILSFSPTPLFIQVFRREEKIDILPEGMLLCQLLNKLLWCSVWVLTKKLIPFINAAVVILITTIFLTLYLFLYFHRRYLKTLGKLSLLLFFESAIIFGTIIYGNTSVISLIAMIFNSIIHIVQGQNIIRFFKEKNYKLIPIYNTIISICCSGFWLLYGISINLTALIIPNILGLFFSIVNTFAWIYCYFNGDISKYKEETFAVIYNNSFNYS